MDKNIMITVQNRLVMDQRDINVYHHSGKSNHLLSFNSSRLFQFQPEEKDYLHISILSGPGRLNDPCIINIPSWVSFEISSAGDATVTHGTERTFLKIPAGLPSWQLKIKGPKKELSGQVSDYVMVGDSQMEYQWKSTLH